MNNFNMQWYVDWNASNGVDEFILDEYLENAKSSVHLPSDDIDVRDLLKMIIKVLFQYA